jgi:hypothetical protein
MRSLRVGIVMVLCTMSLSAPESAIAGNVYLQKGEGGAGLDAWFELDELNH